MERADATENVLIHELAGVDASSSVFKTPEQCLPFFPNQTCFPTILLNLPAHPSPSRFTRLGPLAGHMVQSLAMAVSGGSCTASWIDLPTCRGAETAGP